MRTSPRVIEGLKRAGRERMGRPRRAKPRSLYLRAGGTASGKGVICAGGILFPRERPSNRTLQLPGRQRCVFLGKGAQDSAARPSWGGRLGGRRGNCAPAPCGPVAPAGILGGWFIRTFADSLHADSVGRWRTVRARHLVALSI